MVVLLYLILGIIGIFILIGLIVLVLKILKYVFAIAILLLGLYLAVKFYYISIPLLIIYVIYCFIKYLKYRWSIRSWIRERVDHVLDTEIDSNILPLISGVKLTDENEDDYKFDLVNIPYGRANAFLNYFETSIDTDEVYYYSAIKSKDKNELREYGIMITRYGLYISKQIGDSGSNSNDKFFPFANLWKCEMIEGHLNLYYIDLETKKDFKKQISPIDIRLDNEKLIAIFERVINYKYNHALGKQRVVTENEYYQKLMKLKGLISIKIRCKIVVNTYQR